MGLYKSWVDDTTKLFAAEADAISRLLGLLSPGLISPAGNYNFAKASILGTTIKLVAFGATDRIVSARAIAAAYYRDNVDFATAGEAGGALPAGTYNIYLDIHESATAAKAYLAWPRAMTAAVDESVYLVVAQVAWNGAALSSLVDDRAGKWGVLDLTGLATGALTLTDNDVVIGDDRDWLFEGTVRHTGPLVSEITTLGKTAGGGIVNIRALTYLGINESYWQFLQPSTIESLSGDLQIDLGEASGISMGAGSHLRLTGLNTGFELGAEAWAIIDGTMFIMPGGDLSVSATGRVIFETGDPPATHAPNQCSGAAIAKAWALIEGTGAIKTSMNVASIAYNNPGVYDVVFQSPMESLQYVVVPTIYAGGAADSCRAMNLATTGFRLMQKNAAGALSNDYSVGFVVFGGNQTL